MNVTDTNESRAHGLVAAVNDAAEEHGGARLGIITPLTGPGDATAGELIVRGACLGVEYLRSQAHAFQKPIQLAVVNDQETAAVEGMARSAVGALAKLVMIDKVVALLGQWHLRTSAFVADTAERLGIPIFIENGHNTITGEDRRTVFRTYFSIADRMPLVLGFLRDQNMQRVGMLAANTVFGGMIADTFESMNKSGDFGLDILRFDFDQETATDLSREMHFIRDFQPDVIVNAGVVRTNYLVVKEAAAQGLRPSVAMMATFPFPMRSDDFWRLTGGDAGNLIVWPCTRYRPSMAGLTPIGHWFTESYTRRYRSFPPDNALNAFTDVTILGQALERTGTDDRNDLIDALETGSFDTWRGPISFDRGLEHWHHSPPEVVLMQYQGVGQNIDDAAIVYPEWERSAPYMGPVSTG